ncbi:MAG TPA: hypothetical protein VGE36_14215 [Roseateles sp.]
MRNLIGWLLPRWMFAGLGFGGSSSSSSSSQTNNQNNAWDQRQVLGEGSIGAAAGGIVNLSDMRDLSDRSVTNISDSRDLSTSLNVTDNSDRSSFVSDSRNLSTSLSVVDNSDRSSLTDNSVFWGDSSSRVNSGNSTITAVDPGALKTMEAAMLGNQAVARDAFNFGMASAGTSADLSAAALDKSYSFARDSNATLGAGFSQLLTAGMRMFDSNIAQVQRAGELTVDAFRSATSEKSGSLDNKTILVLGVAAAAALAFMGRR